MWGGKIIKYEGEIMMSLRFLQIIAFKIIAMFILFVSLMGRNFCNSSITFYVNIWANHIQVSIKTLEFLLTNVPLLF